MMYPFMTLEDKTEVVHSEILDEHDTVKVYFEKPVEGDFLSAECYLPNYKWKEVDGFTRDDINTLQEFLESTAHNIIRLAREGGYQ